MAENDIDLTSPEFQREMTAEEIAAAGESKKYKEDTYYPFTISVSEQHFSKPKLKNGELNAEAKASIWLDLKLSPVTLNGAATHKLDDIQYVKVFFYDRLNVAAMQRVGYTAEQIAKVKEMGLPETYDSFEQFAIAAFPERFSDPFPRLNKETGHYVYEGQELPKGADTDAFVKACYDKQKNKVLQIQKELRSNPKLVQGKVLLWNVTYPLENKQDPNGPRKRFPEARYPYNLAKPPKDKDGNFKPIGDPEKDFA